MHYWTVSAQCVLGKSTLTDSLLAASGFISPKVAGGVKFSDTREDERQRGLSIRSTGISLTLENKHLINVIDSPGQPSLSAEVTTALRLCDGAILVIDSVEGFGIETRTVLQQATDEMVKPVLAINKIDRLFLELQLDGEQAYQKLKAIVDMANKTISNSPISFLEDVLVSPENGTVSFSSGLHGWGFTLADIAEIYDSTFDKSRMVERLWGENYFDPTTKRWTDKPRGTQSVRGFVYFCYQPIKQIIDACLNDRNKLWRVLERLKVVLSDDEKDLRDKDLIRCDLQRWLPASNMLQRLVIFKVPSPIAAQVYRVQILYDGAEDDSYLKGIKHCDPDGPLMAYISKMVLAPGSGRIFAYGRIFSGKVLSGQMVRIMNPTYSPTCQDKDVCTARVLNVGLWMTKKLEPVETVCSGNIVAFDGLEDFINKTATLTSEKEYNAYPIRGVHFSVGPIFDLAVTTKFKPDRKKLVQGLKKLCKLDPLLVVKMDKSHHQDIIVGTGELHVQSCLKELTRLISGVTLVTSDPSIIYTETVSQSGRIVMSKSKKNRILTSAKPLDDSLGVEIEKGRVDGKVLQEQYGWPKEITSRIMCFSGANMLIDMTEGVVHKKKVVEAISETFEMITNSGVLANCPMRNILFVWHDAILDPDIEASSRVVIANIVDAVTKAFYASQLAAIPRLMEPTKIVQINVPNEAAAGAYCALRNAGGSVIEEEYIESKKLLKVMGSFPACSSFGFDNLLRKETRAEVTTLLCLTGGVKWTLILFWNKVKLGVLSNNSEA